MNKPISFCFLTTENKLERDNGGFRDTEESYNIENCDYRSCPKRHQRDCKFYKFRSFCKRGANCQFKHVKNNTPENKNEKSQGC